MSETNFETTNFALRGSEVQRQQIEELIRLRLAAERETHPCPASPSYCVPALRLSPLGQSTRAEYMRVKLRL